MKQLNIYMISLGCAKNLVDSEVMLGHLPKDRYAIVTDEAQADIILINTCAFVEEAKEESVDAILDAAEYKTRGSCRLLAVCGCLPQRYSETLMRELPEADLLFGIGEIPHVAELLEQALEQRTVAVNKTSYLYDHTTPRTRSSPFFSAYVKISEGCDNHCAYCVIPSLRGPLRSREIASVVEETRQLVASGVREINLVAQDVTAFGLDRGKRELGALLRELVRIDDLGWLRVLYAHPAGIDDELIDLVAGEEKICKYLDIPIQHIDDEILERMNRHTDSAGIRALLEKLRARIPDVTLRTSLITGFPGETDAQFARLLDFVQEGWFDRIGVFRYSREEGTPAAEFPDQVPARISKLRLDRLMKAQKRISFRKNRALIGKVEPVLVEGVNEETDLLLRGRCARQAPDVDGQVYITAGQAVVGDIVPLRITDSSDYDLIGEIVEDEEL